MRNAQRKVAPRHGLSASEALAKLAMIDASLDAFCSTAPRTVEALGGRDRLLSVSQFTCVGPIPRLSADDWGLMSQENRAMQVENLPTRVHQGNPPEQAAGPAPVGSSFRIVRTW